MKAGILLPQTGESATRENVLYIAKKAEKEGLDSVGYLTAFYGPSSPKIHLICWNTC
jgi:hypothetical protein